MTMFALQEIASLLEEMRIDHERIIMRSEKFIDLSTLMI
jgi:hypothetical protein